MYYYCHIDVSVSVPKQLSIIFCCKQSCSSIVKKGTIKNTKFMQQRKGQ